MFQCSRSSIGYIWNVSFFHLTGPTLFFFAEILDVFDNARPNKHDSSNGGN